MNEPAKFSTYKDLIVYQKTKQLNIDVLNYFSRIKLPRNFDFLINQLFRAVSSIGANIVEGYGRHSRQNFRQFLSIARGSSFEVEYWFEIMLEIPNFDKRTIENFLERNIEIMKMLTVMMKRLEAKKVNSA